MISDLEMEKIKKLINKQEKYLNDFKGLKEYKYLSNLYYEYELAYTKFSIAILSATPMPRKPLDAYIAGGMANGVAGIGAGVAAFHDSKVKEINYQQAMVQYNSTMKGIDGAFDELAHYYGAIIGLLKINPKSYDDWQMECKKLEERKKKEKELNEKFEVSFISKVSLVPAVFFGGIAGIAAGDFMVFVLVGGMAFFMTCLILKVMLG